MRCGTVSLAILAVLALALDARAQVPASDVPKLAEANLVPDYQLGPGDQVSIHVQGVREFSQSCRLSNSGRVRVPYVGIMFAAGKTVDQLEREIADRIRDHELVNEPLVRVEIEQQRSSPAFVVGEVVTPGQFVIAGELYILDLISRAGGLQSLAGSTAYLHRGPKPSPEVTARVVASEEPVAEPLATPTDATPAPPARPDGEVIEINLDEMMSGERPELNLRVNGGDVLYVPRRPMRNIYIIGDVNVPGVYALPRRGSVTAAQAIIYAGGPTATAKVKSGFLMRYNAAGNHEATPVHFSDILSGKAPDIPVEPGDIIFIPNSPVKTIGVGLLNMIPNLIIQFLIF